MKGRIRKMEEEGNKGGRGTERAIDIGRIKVKREGNERECRKWLGGKGVREWL